MLKSRTKGSIDSTRKAPAIDALRTRALSFCDERLSALFDSAGPALLGFAELAGSELAQSLFFAAAAQLETRQSAIHQRFLQIIDQGLTHFFSQDRTRPRPWLPHLETVDADRFSLHQDEALALKNLIIRTNAHCFPELYALSQRLAVIAGGGKLRDDEIPAGPHHLAHGFRAAIADDQFDIRVKVVLYALFHHRVTWFAAALYRELNDILRDAGILPKTRPVNLRQTRHQRQHLGANLREAKHPEDHANTRQALTADLLELAESLDNSRTGQQADNGMRTTAPDEDQDTDEHSSGAASSLNSFLSAVARSADSTRPILLPPGVRTDRIAIGQLNKIRTDTRDAELISAIELMFAQMFDTPSLPSSAKVTLGQWQIPYLRAALNNISLWRDPGHPARALLDECVEAGCRWIDESDPRSGAMPILEEISDRILDTPDGESPPFDALLEHLHQHTRNLRQPRHLPERRSRDLDRERKHAREARRIARAEILALLRPYEVPRQVRVFLDTTWVELLTLVRQHRDEGPDSPSWHEALDTARGLIEVFDPRITGAALRARITELPRLRQRVAYGAQRLGSYNRATLATLDNLLANPHGIREQLRRAQGLPSRPPTHRPINPTLLTDFDGSPLAEEDRQHQETPELPEGDLLAMIDELRNTKSGTWFELDSPVGDCETHSRRIQLSWISPLTSTYLFIDEAGSKTEMRGLKDLAQAMLSGRARVIDPSAVRHPQTFPPSAPG